MPDDTVISDVEDALISAGLPSEITPSVLAAIDAAGYDLVAKGGGDPAVTVDSVEAERVAVAGIPGTYIVTATMGDGSLARWLESPGGVRQPLGMIPPPP